MFVRPQLRYGQVIWVPHIKKHIIILEKVHAIKLVDGQKHFEYTKGIRRLDLPSLAYRKA